MLAFLAGVCAGALAEFFYKEMRAASRIARERKAWEGMIRTAARRHRYTGPLN